MSWSYNKTGRAKKLAEVVKQQIVDVGGCPAGSHEETAKNQLADVVETLCKSFDGDQVVSIKASGSAWTMSDGRAKSQHLSFELTTIGDFVE